uniref:Uncharacterized protein n=1 Tax=uncultured marine crenarchaeote HF4000_APKG10I20 TaxID=455612 RepID=B3TCF7_9ARCH|nr:hypothetical protein ALOHA_HF4000APKG10I20ctg2g2 [uncultured marine crenarchaeote HF4000_APKG10I20]
MGKILAGKASDIPSGKMIMVSADGKDILVTNVDGNYYAMAIPARMLGKPL